MTGSDTDTLRTELVAIFREEAAEHLDAITAELAALDRAGAPEAERAALDRLFRIAHTLKGAARSLSISGVERLCHAIEDLCAGLVRGRVPLDAAIRDELGELTDDLARATGRALAPTAGPPAARPATAAPAADALPATGAPAIVPAGSPAPGPGDGGTLPPASPAIASPSAPPPAAPESPPLPADPAVLPRDTLPVPAGASAFVRLEAGQIQRLGLMAEHLLAPRLATQARAEEARRLHARLHALRRTGPAAAAGADEAAPPPGEELRAAEEAARALAAALAEDNRALRSLVDSLTVALRRARMIPAGDLLAAFPAMVADLARDLGKSVRLRITGRDLLIDRQVADLIKDPLIHMVRNAIDHGIEPADRRVAAGKPAEGTVTLAIGAAERGRVAFEIADDGAGIDLKALRAAAVRNRLLSDADARAMGDADAVDLVFLSHLSTRSVISLTSGRGLGLAIARERVERLGGSIRVQTAAGTGTVLHMAVPGALANFRGIGVRVDGTDYVWPREAVERTLALPAADARAARTRGLIRIDGELLPFGDLARILGRPDRAPPAGLTGALLVRAGPRRGVVAVPDVTGDCEAVVKELRPPLLRVRHVLAAGLLGSGRLALILRPADILDALTPRSGAPDAPPPPEPRHGRPRLLVVDDSHTTRAMEAGLLEAAGYDVTAAADGQDAWDILQRHPFDAVVSDIDMPRLDGFALTERIRADARLKQMPVLLVTAMERREDHDRGLRLGANAYVMKSAFDQTLLIDLVRRVL